MVCNKCGTEVSKQDKFCTKCGAEVEKQEKKQEKKGHKKVYIIAGIIFALVLAIVIFKYNALILLSILAIVCAAVLINRKILNMRKKNNNEGSIGEHNFSDAEMKKFSEYFISREEKYISSLGNGYIMNFFANGSLKRGFAIISDKRVYFRGSCFSGQGRTLKKTDEERTVDIKDVTGSGFVYRRYIGILLALITAIVTLLGGIGGSTVGAIASWGETQYKQGKADELAEKLDEIKDGEKDIERIEKEIVKNEEDIQKLNEELIEVNEELVEVNEELVEINALQTKSAEEDVVNAVMDELMIKWSDDLERKWTNGYNCHSFYDATGTKDAYDNYFHQLYCVYKWSDAYKQFCNSLAEYGINFEIEYNECSANSSAFFSGAYRREDSLYFTPERYVDYVTTICNSVSVSIDNGWMLDGLPRGESYDELVSYFEGKLGDIQLPSYDEFVNELEEPFAQAYKDFQISIVSDYLEQEDSSLEKAALSYLGEPSDATQKVTAEIENLEAAKEELSNKIENLEVTNKELSDKIDSINSLMNQKEEYQRRYDEQNKTTFFSYVLTTVASGLVALLSTLLISCILTFADYLKKRKTLFEIQYAGGRIAFDVSYYAKAEIDDFQKQLRRAKDFAQETATVKTVTVEAPVQTPVQAPTQNNVPDDLRKYAELLKEGLISQEEYDAIKKQILGL